MSSTTKNRIKVMLAEKEKTNRWLAKKISKDETTISRWCTNRVQPTLDTLGEIANILNVDVRDLISPMKSHSNNQETM